MTGEAFAQLEQGMMKVVKGVVSPCSLVRYNPKPGGKKSKKRKDNAAKP